MNNKLWVKKNKTRPLSHPMSPFQSLLPLSRHLWSGSCQRLYQISPEEGGKKNKTKLLHCSSTATTTYLKRWTVSHLPKIKTQNTNVVKLVDVRVWAVFRIFNFRMHPGSFVVGVINLLGLPFSLKYRKLKGLSVMQFKSILNILYINVKVFWWSISSLLCTLGWGSWVAPTLRPYPHPSLQAS